MEAWQIAGLIALMGAAVLVWPGVRARLAAGEPMLRWAAIWAVAILGVMLAYEILRSLGLDLTPSGRLGR
ncbi:hypothetical protein [Elioraea thermophila]|uniref:hypothetical protein n=1 Tax=Elioraea thermophila TaxID=2185104 RepID=UPI000DF346D3|nr:hypothetical protein [Elioraea thermophila]